MHNSPTIYVHDAVGWTRWGDLGATFLRLLQEEPFPTSVPTQPSQPSDRHADETDGEAFTRRLLTRLFTRFPENEQTQLREKVGLFIGHTTSGLMDAVRLSANATDARLIRTIDLGRLADRLQRHLALSGPIVTHSTACTSSGKAIIDAVRHLRLGRLRWAIAGGLDFVNAFTLAGFQALGALSPRRAQPFCATRSGLHLGNGGAFFLLSTQEYFAGKKARARLTGYGESNDAHHISAPHPEGLGARLSMQRALDKAQYKPADIDFIFAHGTATEQNDRTESIALERLFGSHTPCMSVKRATGHTLAGAAAVNLGLAWELLQAKAQNYPIGLRAQQTLGFDCYPGITRSPSINQHPVQRILINAFAFGGSCLSLCIEKNE